jgi:hypothetical protein
VPSLTPARRPRRQPREGIANLQAALTVFTRETDPQSWGKAHNNIGIAYWGRIHGERADNQENAIAHFEQALAIFSRESADREWAQLQKQSRRRLFAADQGRGR